MVDGWFGHQQTQKKLWQIADQFLAKGNPAQFNQALMDLGSQVCTTANINCQKCPLIKGCKAYKQNKQASYPEKKAKKTKPRKETTLLIILNSQNQILLEKRPPMGIWGGLWSLPEINQKQSIARWFEQNYPFCQAQFLAKLDSRPHTFTHFHLEIKPQIWLINESKQDQVKEDQAIWYDFNQPIKKGLAKPVSQILSEMKRWNKNDSKSSPMCAIEKTS
jgi:A/G-specific adenine glycosylase